MRTLNTQPNRTCHLYHRHEYHKWRYGYSYIQACRSSLYKQRLQQLDICEFNPIEEAADFLFYLNEKRRRQEAVYWLHSRGVSALVFPMEANTMKYPWNMFTYLRLPISYVNINKQNLTTNSRSDLLKNPFRQLFFNSSPISNMVWISSNTWSMVYSN